MGNKYKFLSQNEIYYFKRPLELLVSTWHLFQLLPVLFLRIWQASHILSWMANVKKKGDAQKWNEKYFISHLMRTSLAEKKNVLFYLQKW